ncbi:hypothetical protein SAMN02927921_03448 [Sinomicrobium oceani]|uniref:Lipoprotein n=1 Tax=Sinomicrobium oceani TaxID=1150368 RepID=A0A1K1REJ3_9FLAO|nr:hypothetical protein [Sinomicrobium oceani]SFW70300.1 hypothetical protein SAMN02927921_03448 [Sinomicrobium oceani]
MKSCMLSAKIFVLTIILYSCQSRMEVSQVVLNEDVSRVIKDKKEFFSEQIHPSAGLPLLYTYDVQHYTFGDVDFKNNSQQTALGINSVGFYLYKAYNKEENKIAGIRIEVHEQGEELFSYLKEKYGEPEELAPEPETRYEGIVHGISAYIWKSDAPYTVILSKSYATKDKEQLITTTVYILNNDAVDSTADGRTSVERLIQSLKQ